MTHTTTLNQQNQIIPENYKKFLDNFMWNLTHALSDLTSYIYNLGTYQWVFKPHYDNIVNEYHTYQKIYRIMQAKIKDTFQDNPQLRDALLKRLHNRCKDNTLKKLIENIKVLDPSKLPQGPRYTCSTDDIIKNNTRDNIFDSIVDNFKRFF